MLRYIQQKEVPELFSVVTYTSLDKKSASRISHLPAIVDTSSGEVKMGREAFILIQGMGGTAPVDDLMGCELSMACMCPLLADERDMDTDKFSGELPLDTAASMHQSQI